MAIMKPAPKPPAGSTLKNNPGTNGDPKQPTGGTNPVNGKGAGTGSKSGK